MIVVTGLEIDGVQAPKQRAGTPSSFPLMHVSGGDSLDVLEFSLAMDLVAGMAAGPLGADSVRARVPSSNPEWIRYELALVGELLALRSQGESVDVAPVPALREVISRLRIEGSVLAGPEFVAVRTTLRAARDLSRQLHGVGDRAPGLFGLAAQIPDPGVVGRLDRSFDDDGEVLDAASPGLATARRQVQVVRARLIRKLETIHRNHDPHAGSSGVTVRNGRYVIPVRRDARDGPRGIVHDESGSSGTLFVEPTDAIELGNTLREALQNEAREVHRVLTELSNLLRPLSGLIDDAHRMCVEVDDILARARYAEQVGATPPTLVEDNLALWLSECRHPILLGRIPDTVPFDLELEAGDRTLIVSGPNAGGKTVLLKAIGLAVAMVHAGVIPPFGAGCRIPLLKGLFADIGDHQSITADLSTFSAHASALRDILVGADDQSLVLLDEMGSGTDPAEGAALAWAALESLTRRGTLTVATTHLGALKTLASEEVGVVNGSLEFDAANLSPSYRFNAGVPGRSYGLAIAKRLGVPPEVVTRAEERVPHQELALDALLRDAEARARRLAERERTLDVSEGNLQDEKAAVEAKLVEIDRRERDLRERERQAQRQAQSLVTDALLAARREVEEAIGVAAQEGKAREARRMVEDAIIEARAIRDDHPAEPSRRSGTTSLARGDRVRLRDGVIGRVREIREDTVEVTAGSLRLVVPVAHVIETLPDEPAPKGTEQGRSDAVEARADVAPLEIDLRGHRVDEAEMAMIAALDAAVLADHPSLKVIHGKGTGAVRERVHEVLSRDPRVSQFALAPLKAGGSGVTIVEFRA
jgi:DNA mismatch repair protein MutS2